MSHVVALTRTRKRTELRGCPPAVSTSHQRDRNVIGERRNVIRIRSGARRPVPLGAARSRPRSLRSARGITAFAAVFLVSLLTTAAMPDDRAVDAREHST